MIMEKTETNKQYIINAIYYSFYYMIIFASISITLLLSAQIINNGRTTMNPYIFLFICFSFGWAMFHIKRADSLKS